ncbi:MAG: hypothetical protein R2728_02960 [Chitinophagales bacterium]
MQAVDYIDTNIPYLKANDSIQFALDIMAGNSLTEMPVLKGKKYIGSISEDVLLNIDNSNIKIGTLPLENESIFIYETQHIFELIKKMIETQMYLMPIIDVKDNYIGIANSTSILTKLGNSSSLMESGGMLVLQMNKTDYSLSEIARIVESNDALILNCFISSQIDINQIEVTLKINKKDLEDIVASFERYEYNVKAAYHQSSSADDVLEKYESFMHYLNM